MILVQISANTVIFALFLRIVKCSELYDLNMIKDIQQHFNVNWIIVQTCKKTDNIIITLIKDIKESMNVYINVYEWEDFSEVTDFGVGGSFRPLVFLSCWSCPLNCLTPINEIQSLMPRFIWLLRMRENVIFNLSDVNIPMDSLFIIATNLTSDITVMNEVYRVSFDTDLIYSQIGVWGVRQGLNYTMISLEERRSNFFGHNITTLMERDDTDNPMITILNHFTPSYFDLAKRLNFTVHKKTDPKEPHEVSIIMSWADVPSKKATFLPFYGSRQSIFFKDMGIGISLDGYITPFQTTVWQALMFVVILSGLLSYISAKVYARLTRNRRISRRIDFYIYNSFYIFCQKGEIEERNSAHRIITISQWILSIFVLSCYSAIFISFISFDVPKPPFTNLDELLDTRGYNMVTSKHINYDIYSFLQSSGDPKLRQLYETHFDPIKNAVEDVPTAFCGEKHYLLITSEVHIAMMKRLPQYSYCTTSKYHITLNLRHLTWFIKKNSHFKRILQRFLTKLTTCGVMQNCFIQRMTFKNLPESSDFRGITMEDTTMLFITIASGLLVSISILILEIVHKKLTLYFY